MKDETTSPPKIPFDEIQAKTTIQKFGLDSRTFYVWKVRGKIPAKYLTEDYQKPVKLSRAEVAEEKKLVAILKHPALNLIAFCEIGNIKYSAVTDALRQRRTPLSRENIVKIRKALHGFRIEIKKVIEPLAGKVKFTADEKLALDKLLLDERIVVTQLLGIDKYSRNTTYNRHLERRQGKSILFEEEEACDIRDGFVLFLLSTNL
jgi:hypothetical protein